MTVADISRGGEHGSMVVGVDCVGSKRDGRVLRSGVHGDGGAGQRRGGGLMDTAEMREYLEESYISLVVNQAIYERMRALCDEVDRLRGSGSKCMLAISHGCRCHLLDCRVTDTEVLGDLGLKAKDALTGAD